jgi:acetyl/propionyl-CoA carboxylase alpha subunit
MIRILLVANRAEVASRVFRTARSLGIRTIAVYTEADAALSFVAEADEAVCIGESAVADTYLSIDAILAAARKTGADAIHPGYGFLAERADFAAAVQAAGLTWVGPSPDVIRAMGDKAAARRLAVEAGVPVVPGYDGAEQTVAAFTREAAAIGYPVMLKAAAGGGGRGMRIVHAEQDLAEAFASAAREAGAAFGDPTLLIERLVERPRHVEVQVFGDGKGNVVHLFERECSIQRRHQKIVEEAPAPALDPTVRAELLAAAVRLAEAVDYAGAGTVEFIVGPSSWAFLEMNTRLQVEHEVTECITGVDLVAWQLAIAEGGALPRTQDAIEAHGSAIEVRLYAEDPDRDWLPTHGELVRVDVAADRLSTSFQTGDTVTVHYDPMLAKIVATGPTRATAVRRLAHTLARAWVPGITTNLPLLRTISMHPAFVAGTTHTGFLAEHGLPQPPPANTTVSLLAAGLVQGLALRSAGPPGVPPGFRIDGPAWDTARWQVGEPTSVAVRWRGEVLEVRLDGTIHALTVHGVDGDAVRLTHDGVQQTWRLATADDRIFVHTGRVEGFAIRLPRFPIPQPPSAEPGSCTAPTPGTVRAVHVTVGDTVQANTPLVVLEAMKMEHVVRAPEDGVVAAVRCAVGDTVDAGDLLVRLDPTQSPG